MIYWVDEDVNQLQAHRFELDIRGFSVTTIDNADSAFQILSIAKDIEFVIFDVMLATSNENISRYDREHTRDFTTTGLSLIQDLIENSQLDVSNRSIIFSMASKNWIVQEIVAFSKAYSIPYLSKKDFYSPMDFGDKIESIIAYSIKGKNY